MPMRAKMQYHTLKCFCSTMYLAKVRLKLEIIKHTLHILTKSIKTLQKPNESTRGWSFL